MTNRAIAARIGHFRQELLMFIMVSRRARFCASRRCQDAFSNGQIRRQSVSFKFRFPLIMFGPLIRLIRIFLITNTMLTMVNAIRREREQYSLYERQRLKALTQVGQIISETAKRNRIRTRIVALAINGQRMLPIARGVTLMERLNYRLRMIVQPLRALARRRYGAVRLSEFIQIMVVLMIIMVTMIMRAMTVRATVVTIMVTIRMN